MFTTIVLVVHVAISLVAIAAGFVVAWGLVAGKRKVPALDELAPKGNEPPFAIAQLAVLAAFVVLGVLAAVRFRVHPADTEPL